MASIKGLERTLVALDKGIVRSPSIGKDGELSECINVWPRGGEMVNQPRPIDYSEQLPLDENEVLVYLHHHDGVINYITSLAGKLNYLRKVSGENGEEVWEHENVGYDYFAAGARVTSLGRILIIYGENTPAAALMWAQDADGKWHYESDTSFNRNDYGISVSYAGAPIGTRGVRADNTPVAAKLMDGSVVNTGSIHNHPHVLGGTNGEINVLVYAGAGMEQRGWGYGITGLRGTEDKETFGRALTDSTRSFTVYAESNSPADTKNNAVLFMRSLLGVGTAALQKAAANGLIVAPTWFFWELRNASNEIVASGNPTLICPNQVSVLPNFGVYAYYNPEHEVATFVPQASVPAYSCAFNVALNNLPSDTSALTLHIYMTRQAVFNTLRNSATFTFEQGAVDGVIGAVFPRAGNHFYVLGNMIGSGAWKLFTAEQKNSAQTLDAIRGELPDFFEVWSGSVSSLLAAKKEDKSYVRVRIKSEYIADFADVADIVTDNTVNLNQSATYTYRASGRSSSIQGKYLKCAMPYNGRVFYAGFMGASGQGGVLKEYTFNDMFASAILDPLSWDWQEDRDRDFAAIFYGGGRGAYHTEGANFYRLAPQGINIYNTLLIKYSHLGEFFYSSISGSALRGIIRSIFLPTYIAEISASGEEEDYYIATSVRLAKIEDGKVVQWTKEIEVKKGKLGYYASAYAATLYRVGSPTLPDNSAFRMDTDTSAAAVWLTDTLNGRSGDMPDGYAMSAYASTNIPGAADFQHLSGSAILDCAVVTRPVSQGQFGQHPIMLFTDSGVWAVGVDADGAVKAAPQPVTREVAYPGTILLLDDALSFVSSKGLVLLSGNDVINVSEAVCGHNTDLMQFLDAGGLTDIPFKDDKDFRERLRTAQFFYDYANSAIHAVYKANDEQQVHYVYNLTTRAWTTQSLVLGDITNIVHGYPADIIQVGTRLLCYDYEYDSEYITEGLVLTKPLTLGDATARKMLYDLKVIGQRTTDNSKMQVMVFISNDCRNWYRLRSLKGMSAKYYRLLISTKMTDVDTLSGVVLQHVARFDKKMR